MDDRISQILESSENVKKKDRTANFGIEETEKFKELIEKYYVVFNKKTDAASIKQKDMAWTQITNEMNEFAHKCRTKKQLIYKFNNMKKSARKEFTHQRFKSHKSGGPTKIGEWMNTIMGESMTRLQSQLDSDFPIEAINSGAVQHLCESIINDGSEYMDLDKSTSKENFKLPPSPSLEETQAKRYARSPAEVRKSILNLNKKKEDLIMKRTSRETKLLQFAEEEHKKNMEHMSLLHRMEVEFKKNLYEINIQKAKIELEIANKKLKSMERNQ